MDNARFVSDGPTNSQGGRLINARYLLPAIAMRAVTDRTDDDRIHSNERERTRIAGSIKYGADMSSTSAVCGVFGLCDQQVLTNTKTFIDDCELPSEHKTRTLTVSWRTVLRENEQKTKVL